MSVQVGSNSSLLNETKTSKGLTRIDLLLCLIYHYIIKWKNSYSRNADKALKECIVCENCTTSERISTKSTVCLWIYVYCRDVIHLLGCRRFDLWGSLWKRHFCDFKRLKQWSSKYQSSPYWARSKTTMFRSSVGSPKLRIIYWNQKLHT